GRGARIPAVPPGRGGRQVAAGRVGRRAGMRDRRYGPAEVEARFGVPPAQLLDLRALVGDTSDNIPGVHGIGEKGAAQLIREWGDLETLLVHAGEVKNKRAREALIAHADDARLSKRLATLRDDIAFEVDYERYRRAEPDRARLRELYRRLEFVRLLEALDAESPAAPAAAAAPPAGAAA